VLHASNEPCELSQWQCHDDSTANIVIAVTISIVVALRLAGHLDMVKFLLEQGANLEHKTDEMHTALMEASMDGHVDVARYLLDRGAQVIA